MGKDVRQKLSSVSHLKSGDSSQDIYNTATCDRDSRSRKNINSALSLSGCPKGFSPHYHLFPEHACKSVWYEYPCAP